MLVKHIIRTISKQNPATGRYNFPGIKNTNNNTPILRRNFNTEIEKEKIYKRCNKRTNGIFKKYIFKKYKCYS